MSPWPGKRASHNPFTAASWFPVSTGHQGSDNQMSAAEQFAAHHGYEIAESYAVSDTAWTGGRPPWVVLACAVAWSGCSCSAQDLYAAPDGR